MAGWLAGWGARPAGRPFTFSAPMVSILVSLAAWTASCATNGKTNVVMLLADDLGFGDPGYQGGRAKTPHLDAMSQSPHSLVFNRFYCGGAVCSPTRASILTGRTPNRACIWDYINRATHMHLPHSEFTLGDAAAAAGMLSGHFGKVRLPAHAAMLRVYALLFAPDV